MKIPCLLCPKLLIKHRVGPKLLPISYLKEKSIADVSKIFQYILNVTTSSMNLLKAIANISVTLPGGGRRG